MDIPDEPEPSDPELDPELLEPPESPDPLTSELASEVGAGDPPDEPQAHHHARALNVTNAVRVPFAIKPLTDTFRSRMSCSRGTPSSHCSLRRKHC